MAAQKFAVPLGGGVPAGILYKAVITAQVHREQLAAVRAVGGQVRTEQKFSGWYSPARSADHPVRGHTLCFYHLPDECLIVESLLTAWFTALEQAVIALRVEQPLLVKASLLKAVINVRGDDKIILVLYQL